MAGPSQRCMSKSTPLEFLASKQESKKHISMHFIHPSTKTLGIPQATTEPQTQSGQQQRVYPEAWEWICLSSSAATGPRPPLTKKTQVILACSWHNRVKMASTCSTSVRTVFHLISPHFWISSSIIHLMNLFVSIENVHLYAIKTYQNHVYCRSL